MLRKAILIVIALCFGYGGYVVYSEYASAFYYLAGRYDRMMNPYGLDPEAPKPTADETAFHESMFVADLHVDTLKWERDLLERSTFGHTDIPRMREGNISMQVFTIVTKSPIRSPWRDCVNGGNPDANTLLSAMQGRPTFDLRARAFHQIDRFKDAAARSLEYEGPELRLIESADDLETFLADWSAGEEIVAGIIGIEGAHWIGGRGRSDDDVRADVRDLHDAGVRLFGPVHRFDNSLSGSSEGCQAYGLTGHGRAAVTEAQNLGMTIDLAHMSPAGIHDAVEILEKPFTVSHTGIRAECEEPCRPDRNLGDDDVRLIIENGGLIGVGYWPQAIGPSIWRLPEVMDHIKTIAEDIGQQPSRHVALGSDFDGSVAPLIEVSRLDTLTALMERGPAPFDRETIRDISGRNVCRMFATTLPGGYSELGSMLCDDLGTSVETPVALR
ncbi:membrane dipeptidase [Fodinicurvata sp. EGI_FJ10296]|uniref:dipeptidase n=1 Tax=Fodinicurvata sp. EGI_FJ10296 TaxID=3231908 RepID=UPI0034560F5A